MRIWVVEVYSKLNEFNKNSLESHAICYRDICHLEITGLLSNFKSQSQWSAKPEISFYNSVLVVSAAYLPNSKTI